MLTELQLENYRGFSKHQVSLKDEAIIVGRNNAGKSTIIEAITLVSIAISRAPNSRFVSPPDWLDAPSAIRGISPSLKGIDFEFRNLGHRLDDELPSIVTAKFHDNKTVRIFLDSRTEGIFVVLRDRSRRPVFSKADARIYLTETINVMPPVGRLRLRERVLQEDYVKSNLDTALAASHFRNQLYFLGESYEGYEENEHEYQASSQVNRYDVFSRLAEKTWPGLRIVSLESRLGVDSEITLLVGDGTFVAEVGWVGQGLQAWLQTCWFLARCDKSATIVLDEPDVFLHADLQRKLIRLVKGHFEQVIVATHSVELLSEVDSESVLIVDKDSRSSNFAQSVPAVQSVINNIGSANNLQLARLWAARRCLFVEGNDLDFLNVFHQLIFSDSQYSLAALPCIPIEGFGNWKHAVGAAIGLRNAGDESILAYCILDSDYRTDEEHQEIKSEAKKHGLNLHIWRQKEIENYVLNPETISRFICARTSKKGPTSEKIRTQIEKICDTMLDDVFDEISNEIHKRDRASGVNSANKKARNIIKDASTFEAKLSLCSGKKVSSAISAWAQKSFGVSFGALTIARQMHFGELSEEIVKIVGCIEKSEPFDF